MKVIGEIKDKSQHSEEIPSSIINQCTSDIPVDIVGKLPKKESLTRTIRRVRNSAFKDEDLTVMRVCLVEKSETPGGVKLVDTKSTHKSSPSDLVDLAKQIQKGNEFVKANTVNQLTVIAEQIRQLQKQARKVLEKSHQDTMLHQAACNMVKKPGTIYYLYQRPSGQNYLSIISPQEWGDSCSNRYLGGFRLEFDQSWTPMEKIQQRESEINLMEKIIQRYNTESAESGITLDILTGSSKEPMKEILAISDQCEET
ncbi:Uncharacterized protein C1orf50 homolog,Uncharacterized protein C1orf50 [Acanthosepion pharaonis]|uniref:Uncharacterized protein C1orf50 homolog,Uncharacterized protein C1orf50 n=1 Tax=Acanthosepion pharaonis TaxID=158019 RepID=A0A812EIQ2_ACAPH|nr:Uncharacterized protein C1orf50 homolog,Uncharacterized protein C1orf50 [Sepia pharaonis]